MKLFCFNIEVKSLKRHAKDRLVIARKLGLVEEKNLFVLILKYKFKFKLTLNIV